MYLQDYIYWAVAAVPKVWGSVYKCLQCFIYEYYVMFIVGADCNSG